MEEGRIDSQQLDQAIHFSEVRCGEHATLEDWIFESEIWHLRKEEGEVKGGLHSTIPAFDRLPYVSSTKEGRIT